MLSNYALCANLCAAAMAAAAVAAASAGTCSGRLHVPVGQFRSNLLAMVAAAKAAGVQQVLLVTPPPVDEAAWAKEVSASGRVPDVDVTGAGGDGAALLAALHKFTEGPKR
jgi:histidinol dehydrogenase